MKTKYTKEMLEEAVFGSVSIAEVLRKLGLRPSGGTHSYISKKLVNYEIDTSHFLGKRANCGTDHKGGPNKKDWHELLIKREIGNRQKSWKLKRALVESGRDYKCVICGNTGKWMKKLMTLQINHKNQDWLDDRKDNLEFLCPNCHSQTDGWCGRKEAT